MDQNKFELEEGEAPRCKRVNDKLSFIQCILMSNLVLLTILVVIVIWSFWYKLPDISTKFDVKIDEAIKLLLNQTSYLMDEVSHCIKLNTPNSTMNKIIEI